MIPGFIIEYEHRVMIKKKMYLDYIFVFNPFSFDCGCICPAG